MDVAIIGGGIGGLTAGLYAARAGLETLLFERFSPGGQSNNTSSIENFPGFPEGVSGLDLGPLVAQQALEAGVRMELEDITALRQGSDGYWQLSAETGEFRARTVILATGSRLAQLGLAHEQDWYGRGVSSCATCDGPLFSNQDVVVVGGGDSALDEALHLTEYARRVTVVHRGAAFSGTNVTAQRLLAHAKVRVLFEHEVTALSGSNGLSGVEILDLSSGQNRQLDASGLFVFIGLQPNSGLLGDILELDAAGHVPVDLTMATRLPGLYAVGDVRQHSSHYFVAAAGDGATAALAAHRYIRQLQKPQP